MQYHTLPT